MPCISRGQLGHLTWHPTEQLAYLADLTERVKLEGPANLRAPTLLDVRQAVWPVRSADAMFTANTLHIMSWPEVMALLPRHGRRAGARRRAMHLWSVSLRGPVHLGQQSGIRPHAAGARSESGLRDIRAVTALALQYGLHLDADHDLPANNRLLVFIKEPG